MTDDASVMATEDAPQSGRPCAKCKRPTGEWRKESGEQGSWWTVRCDACGNSMSLTRIMPGEFLDSVKRLAEDL